MTWPAQIQYKVSSKIYYAVWLSDENDYYKIGTIFKKVGFKSFSSSRLIAMS